MSHGLSDLPGVYTIQRLRDRLRRKTAGLRRRPNFLIVGAQKGGTSSLYGLLSRHPQVAPATRKEVHFFDLNYDEGDSWYAAQFPVRLGRSRITGEASPYYLFHPHAPRRISRHLPSVRLIAMLRDPVDRAYSHYHHNRRKGREPLGFSEAIGREGERTAGELDRMLEDPGYTSFAHQHYTYLARGRYAEQLAAYLEHFSRARVLVVKSERFFSETGAVWKEVLDYLDLESCPLPERRAYNAGSYSSTMPTGVRERLERYFEPHNRRLAET